MIQMRAVELPDGTLVGPFWSPRDAAKYVAEELLENVRTRVLRAPGDNPLTIFVHEGEFEETLVELWPDGGADISHRAPGESWDPPTPMERRPTR